MFDYSVSFTFDYFHIGTSVYAETDEQAELAAIDRLKEVSGIYIDDMGRYDLNIEVMGRVCLA